MAADPDDDALSWGGGTDPSYLDTPPDEAEEAPEAGASESRDSSAVLVAYGVFGGIFLLYVIGWVVALQQIPLGSSGILAQAMDRFAQFLALLSPALWFFGVLLLLPSERVRTRITWLAVGAVLLAPWPFFFAL